MTTRAVDWYRHAVFYEVMIRGFRDADTDGVGDLPGLIERLDHFQWLGVDCLWLLPFYRSPLRDGGYDISDFLTVHDEFGTVDDVAHLLSEAHRRDIRVIADLVVNHTSDQHPWFVESRASRDNPRADWYVWNDDDERWSEARVIFVDTEPSNWTWDESRGQHYWHRFFSHQPDLNYDCPDVSESMFEVMSHWLSMGLDGFRLDAVPYLYERDGTNGENLPETHQWLKRLRRRVDDAFPGRVLVAEANQPPAEVVDYFGDADECHMAFHFPLMPRLYKALVDHRADTVSEVLAATPAIPEGCQWAIFLRNHDELTLEMVTEDEREVMYGAYAPEPGMRRNVGIGRRLFPLVDDDRRRAELLHSLLLSLPGSPFLYYGDEIGMGERLELGDRDPVRTPMQWDGSTNGGFSAAPADRLYLPSIEDGTYGFGQRNVALHREDPTSFLCWLRDLLASRRGHPAFATGSCEIVTTGDEAVLAYLRAAGEDVVLCVANFADREATFDATSFERPTVRPADHTEPVVPGGVITSSIGASLEGCGLRLDGYGWAWLHVDPHGSRPEPAGC